ncbi:hypothetical protein AO073_27240 [Pseudomonas syringae ICMP 11293]|nr:hypothetical protein AO073_27240 [Pseudomonas syringae ICMP 11293]
MPGDPIGIPGGGDADQIRSPAQLGDLFYRDMTFHKLSIHNAGMTGPQLCRHTRLFLHLTHVIFTVIYHGIAVLLQVSDPFAVAATVRISMNVDGQLWGCL